MAKLIFSLDGAFLGEFALDKEKTTIGRRATNDIHIDNLAVSGQHALIALIGNDAFLEDLDSTNGTIVNGKTIKKQILQHGDVIELGKYQLKFVNEAMIGGAAAPQPADFEKTMMIRPAAMQAMTSAASSTPVAPVPPAAVTPPKPEVTPLANVQVLSGASTGKELALTKALTTLGKPGVQVAVITRRPHGYFITHVEGAIHPIVNGESVGSQAYALKDHDVIEIAGVKMEFYLVQQA